MFSINFTGSSFYFPLNAESSREKWEDLFPREIYPVLAFVGPPSAFPIRPENRIFHRYLEWSSNINTLIDSYIRHSLIKPIVGIHLRNGRDFLNACSHLKSGLNVLFSSAQCHGDFNEFPPNNSSNNLLWGSFDEGKSVYIATDNDPMLQSIRHYLINTTEMIQQVVWSTHRRPEEDMALLARIDLAILNCVSTYSAAIKRERDIKNLPSMFFGLNIEDQRGLEVLCISSDKSTDDWWLKFYRK
ncbi:unnamed protein product [Heterobilharzia americana]|nr:unnamed protein product [Heterobilharzia americana]